MCSSYLCITCRGLFPRINHIKIWRVLSLIKHFLIMFFNFYHDPVNTHLSESILISVKTHPSFRTVSPIFYGSLFSSFHSSNNSQSTSRGQTPAYATLQMHAKSHHIDKCICCLPPTGLYTLC